MFSIARTAALAACALLVVVPTSLAHKGEPGHTHGKGKGPKTITGDDTANVLVGTSKRDRIYAKGGDDTVTANRGSDVVWAGEGNDLVNGNRGNDKILADLGDDTAYGDEGNDRLFGALGNDTLYGFGGIDAFIFNSALNHLNNVDTIGDFGSDDDIILAQGIFPTIALGTLSASAFVIGPAATTAEHRIVYNSATGAIFYDPAGTAGGTPVQFALQRFEQWLLSGP